MKQSPLPKILLGVLAVIAILSAYYSIIAWQGGKELRQFQSKLSTINQRMPLVNALGMDLLEYSKKNPSIDPLLEAHGFKPSKTPAPTTAPAINTPTK